MKVFPKKECSICLDEISREIIETPCGHAFCSPCYKQWSAYRLSIGDTASCPICRREVPRVEFTTRDLFELISNSRNSDVFEFAIDELYKRIDELGSDAYICGGKRRAEIENSLRKVRRISRRTMSMALRIIETYRSNNYDRDVTKVCTFCFVTIWR